VTTGTKPRWGKTDHARDAQAADVCAAWRDRAACAGLDMSPDPIDADATEKAVAVCATCPVLRECSRWVMRLDEAADPGGVCGWMTERARTRWRTSTAIKAGMSAAKAAS
jgi:hypothetical protein